MHRRLLCLPDHQYSRPQLFAGTRGRAQLIEPPIDRHIPVIGARLRPLLILGLGQLTEGLDKRPLCMVGKLDCHSHVLDHKV